MGETLGKPNHYTIEMGDCNNQMGTRTNDMETAKGAFRLERETRQATALENGQIKKVRNNEFNGSEESREEMEVEQPKSCSEVRN